MAANYGSPKPVDPVYWLAHLYLNMRCECGHSASRLIGDLAAEHAIPGSTRMYRIVDRLRCSRCGGRAAVDVTVRPTG